MATTHDGLQYPLPPSRPQQVIGLAILAGSIPLGWFGGGIWYCAAATGVVVGALVFGNQLGGVTRVRVTFSKLLVENERPVMGFLIGPSKLRIPWEEFAGVEITGDRVIAKGKKSTLELGVGNPRPDLESLAQKITEAAERFEREKA